MDKPAPFIDNDYCFACGSKNPLGLQLTFHAEGDSLCTRVNPLPHWQGFEGVIHGGLQATIIDDLMSNYLIQVEKIWATTAELNCRFRKPVPIDRTLLFRARLSRHRGRIWEVDGECLIDGGDQKVLTSAHGRFFELPRPDPC